MSTLTAERAAWETYAEASRGEHFAWWCEQHCRHSVDVFAGQPFALEEWQQAMFCEALAERAEGVPYWSSVAFVIPRKNGKTTLLAAYALYHLVEDDGSPEILLVAANNDQAGRLYDAVVAFARQSAELAARLVIREHVGEVVRADGFGRLYRRSAESSALDGYNPSLVIPDELAVWTTPTARKAWGALTTAGGARRLSQVFSISTAGDAAGRADSILGGLLERNEQSGDLDRPHRALTISRNHEGRTLVYNYDAHTTNRHDADAIRAANPASWVTDAYLARQAANPELSTGEFLRYHGCVWAHSDRDWLDLATWRDAALPGFEAEEGETIVLGFDGSQFADSTALVGCSVERACLFIVGLWESHAQPGWQVPRGEVDAAVADAMRRYRVVFMLADPPGWYSELEAWQRDYPQVGAFPTATLTRMLPALERFETDLRAGELRHADDARLNRHVANARREQTRHAGGGGYRITKRHVRSSDKIDAAVAAVLAWEARARALAAGTTERTGFAFL